MHSAREIIDMARKAGASDLLITVGSPPMVKVDGVLRSLELQSLLPEDTEEIANELLENDHDRAVFREKGERDFSLSIRSLGRFRVNVFMQRGTMAVSVRLIRNELPDPRELLIPDAVMNLTNTTKGLILVTGPAGCGKSTTLAAMIDRINRERACHIITMEDPIEYLHRHNRAIVNQREIGQDTQSYAEGLRAALRQSPDVILIGEMRDLETISIALTAAETGHLVLSTLHTVGSSKTIDRIIDIFPPGQQQQIRIQLSTVLRAVVSQQLLPAKTGGVVPAFEILLANSAVRNLIREGKTYQMDNIITTNSREGMVSMDASLIGLYQKNLITREDVLLYCVNPDAVVRSL